MICDPVGLKRLVAASDEVLRQTEMVLFSREPQSGEMLYHIRLPLDNHSWAGDDLIFRFKLKHDRDLLIIGYILLNFQVAAGPLTVREADCFYDAYPHLCPILEISQPLLNVRNLRGSVQESPGWQDVLRRLGWTLGPGDATTADNPFYVQASKGGP